MEKVEKKEVFALVLSTQWDRAQVELYHKNTRRKTGEILDVANRVGAKAGYVVKIGWKEMTRQSELFSLILPPVLAIIAGLIFGYHMAGYLNYPLFYGLTLGPLLWSVFGFLYSYKYWKYTYGKGLQPMVLEVVKKS